MRLLSFLLIFLGYTAIGQTIATDRPSALTENATSLYKKGIQLESGFLIELDSANIQSLSAPNLLLRYGLIENLELRFMNDVKIEDGSVSLDTWTIGTKIQLIKGEKLNLSLLSSLQIPSLSSDSTNISSIMEQPINTKIIGGVALNNSTLLGYTLGYTVNDEKIGYSLFLSKSLSDKISTFLEIYGLNNQLNIDTGLAYLIQDKLQVDAYFGTGLNNKMAFASVGLSYLYLK